MKELSIEEKAKAYDKAIERVKKLLSRCTDNRDRRTKVYRVEDIESIFPELKESEDEKIRKVLIRFHKSTIDIDGIKGEDIIAWLEKQGNNLVKNGYTKNKDYIRYADRYSHEIWRKLMDNFKNIKDYHIGCNDVSDIVLNAIIDTFNWLEKGGDKNKVSKHVEAINEEKVDDANKVEPKDYSSIDPHFFKTTDKVEPKFHQGEWITNGDYTWKIIEVKPLDYILQSQDGNIVDDTISHVDEQFHSFTIEDAKDGDVLAAHECIVLFKEIDGLNIKCHCTYHFMNNPSFYVNTLQNKSAFLPATKEQRTSLFQKIKEAGYEWNTEKLELKKIKFNPDDLIEESYQQQADDLIDMITEKPTAWSEEDERNMQNIDSVLFYDKTLPQDTYVKLRNFLKSLKQRIGG